MKLTKTQIQFIDNYLIEQGVKYWDVRIELIDHVASKLEATTKTDLNRTYLIKTFGTKISLNKIIVEKTSTLKKLYRKQRLKEFIDILKNPIELTSILLFAYLYYYLFKTYPKFFIKGTMLVFYTPLLLGIILQGYNFIKKNHSIRLSTALNFSFMAYVLLNPLVMFLNLDTSYNKKKMLLVGVTLCSFYAYTAFKVYFKTFKKQAKTYKQLQQL